MHMKNIGFVFVNIFLLAVITISWYLICFLLGYASNLNYQKEILIAYLISIFVHSSSVYIVYRLDKNKTPFKKWIMIINIPLYVLLAWYLYYNT